MDSDNSFKKCSSPLKSFWMFPTLSSSCFVLLRCHFHHRLLTSSPAQISSTQELLLICHGVPSSAGFSCVLLLVRWTWSSWSQERSLTSWCVGFSVREGVSISEHEVVAPVVHPPEQSRWVPGQAGAWIELVSSCRASCYEWLMSVEGASGRDLSSAFAVVTFDSPSESSLCLSSLCSLFMFCQWVFNPQAILTFCVYVCV